MSDILTIRALKKSFSDKAVLRGVDMTVPTGAVFGFIGENGAGKTTTMRAVLGLLAPDAGEITVAGERVRFGSTPTNRYIGYLPDVPAFDPFMTAPEYLAFCGEISHMSRADVRERSATLLHRVGLGGERHRIKGFSRGMKQRLGVAVALMGRPRLLICDEPTSALDPWGRKDILDILVAAREETTVLFSTHILSDIERICTDVALLHEGVIVRAGSMADFRARRPADAVLVEAADEANARRLSEAFADRRLPPLPTDTATVLRFSGQDTLHAVLSLTVAEGLSLRRVELCEPTLESLFLEVKRS